MRARLVALRAWARRHWRPLVAAALLVYVTGPYIDFTYTRIEPCPKGSPVPGLCGYIHGLSGAYPARYLVGAGESPPTDAGLFNIGFGIRTHTPCGQLLRLTLRDGLEGFGIGESYGC